MDDSQRAIRDKLIWITKINVGTGSSSSSVSAAMITFVQAIHVGFTLHQLVNPIYFLLGVVSSVYNFSSSEMLRCFESMHISLSKVILNARCRDLLGF